MLFPERIRQLRQQSGLKQRDVARRIGVDVPMLSRYEHGERRPKREQVMKLARLLKTDPGELVALWLATGALDDIGHDRMADRAMLLLGQQLGVDLSPKPAAEAPEPQAPAEPAKPEPKRDIVSRLGQSPYPQYYEGQALEVLSHVETGSIDCVLTSPPYWSLRRYPTESITVQSVGEFTAGIVAVMAEVHRVLKPSGSLWLNMADAYMDKSLQGLPWRVVLQCIDQQGWTLRNDVVWDKQASAFDSSDDRLRCMHEYIFHLVKDGDQFYYDDESLRIAFNQVRGRSTQAAKGKTSSGVTGARYRENILASTSLSEQEKQNALADLDRAVEQVNNGEIPDFRMSLRSFEGQVIDSKSEKARAINEHGYYILRYNKNGGMPGDVWNIAADRSEIERYNTFPKALCQIIIQATCPDGGIVLDPYCGLGTTCKVAYDMHRRAIGIDVDGSYIKQARKRVQSQPLSMF